MVSLPGLRSRKTVPARSAGELDAMAAAGAVVASALRAVQQAAGAGVSTHDLDEVAETVIRESGAIPSFLGYHGFPASICSSVNDRVVHGIPSRDETLAFGDLVSIDCGAILDGWHGDAAITFGVGALIPADEALSAATKHAMESGIAAMVPGNRLTDVSHAIEKGTRAAELTHDRRFGIVEGYGGHAIGRQMHMDPFLPNEGEPGRGPMLVAGSVLAIEPMLTLGTTRTRILDDEWTVITSDGSRAAHWEHTVAVTDSGPRILTL
ncbi:MAG: type I methionyl aminopeptidase [Mycobacterium sp.]